MKYWCYYTDVVRYLEKVEALCAPKTPRGAYLVWTDDDGPHMIAGPGVYWNRGDGPMPDLDALERSIRAANRAPAARQGSAHARSTRKKQLRAARVSKRSPANALSTRTTQIRAARVSKRSPANALSIRPARQCRAATWRKPPACRIDPPAHHNPRRPTNPAPAREKRRTKGVQLFRNPLKPAHPAPRNNRARQRRLLLQQRATAGA